MTSVSGYSGGGKSMIEAYETGKRARVRTLRASARAQAHAGDSALFGPRRAANLRALGRQFPAGDAGQRAAASRRAAGEADGRRPLAVFGKRYRGEHFRVAESGEARAD